MSKNAEAQLSAEPLAVGKRCVRQLTFDVAPLFFYSLRPGVIRCNTITCYATEDASGASVLRALVIHMFNIQEAVEGLDRCAITIQLSQINTTLKLNRRGEGTYKQTYSSGLYSFLPPHRTVPYG
ncbi:hypothetical protein J6590_097710 [Homalodisca vitripennis]|nr:hypothetical protein J6590_055204 [Homalodisca vitripennis]KAG8334101.1 hypothetical protein J6590_097710 [Homalodisca vitripennis]